MQSVRTGSARLAVTVGAVVAALALSACGPENAENAGPAATAQPTAAPTAATGQPSATTKPAPSGAATTKPAPAPTGTAPAGKHKVVDAPTAGGLAKATGAGAVTDVPVDPGEMRPGMNLVVANYDNPGQGAARKVLVVAVDNVPEDPNKRREHLWRGMIDHALKNGSTGDPTTAKPYAAGPLGGSLECLSLPEAATTDVICGWADGSTAGVALFPKTTPAAAATLFAAMRGDLEK
ncbi:hypothetical protein ACWEQL_14405 [Kitasatospora sp. NPDC004240]